MSGVERADYVRRFHEAESILRRHFIGFELNKEYFDKACKRIDTEQRQLTLF